MNPFHFADPAFFFLLPLALLPLWAQKHAGSFGFSQIALVAPAQRSWRLRLRPFLPWFQAVGIALLVTALARPQLNRAQQISYESETVVIFALDISNSMKAQDLPPNRLETAKQMIETVVSQRPDSQFGLVLFANNAYIQLPPTYDHALFLRALNQVAPAEQMGLPDGTGLGAGIATAAAQLTELAAEKRLVVLFTDGQNTDEAIDPLLVSQAAAQQDIQIYTIAMGKPGLVPFPQPKTEGDTTVVYWESPLDETILQEVADAGGGFYGRATAANPIRQLTAQLLSATTILQPPTVINQTEELYFILLGSGLLLLLISHVLQQTALRQLTEAI